MNLKDTYNKIAKDWHKDHQNDTWWIEGADKLVSLFKEDDTALDVGCGSGVKSKYLIEKGLKVVGIDFSEEMIEIAKREVPKATFYVMDMRDLSELKQNFDGIFAQASLLHVPKNEALNVLTKWAQKLKSGGYLYVGVKAVSPGTHEEAVICEKDYGYEYERFFSFFTAEEIKNYFEKLKLEIVWEQNYFNETPWIQIIGKK